MVEIRLSLHSPSFRAGRTRAMPCSRWSGPGQQESLSQSVQEWADQRLYNHPLPTHDKGSSHLTLLKALGTMSHAGTWGRLVEELERRLRMIEGGKVWSSERVRDPSRRRKRWRAINSAEISKIRKCGEYLVCSLGPLLFSNPHACTQVAFNTTDGSLSYLRRSEVVFLPS